ncbi:hypothetical protein BGX21_003718 [Mortierella sp. AD011]|nr:hypothetical protein BGX21_003718 [Mortierella sp. AD011]
MCKMGAPRVQGDMVGGEGYAREVRAMTDAVGVGVRMVVVMGLNLSDPPSGVETVGKKGEKLHRTGISNEAMAEFPIHSAQAPSEAGRSKDNMGLVAGIDSLNTAKPRDSPSTNRDAIIATLQVKLKREQDLYNANIHNRPTA